MTGYRASPAPQITGVAAGAACLAVLVVSAIAWALDVRELNGASIWAKPMKFGLSFGLHMLTLVWLATLVDERAQRGRWIGIVLVSAGLASILEVLYVALQAARGRASHFNTETPLESFLYYQVMGGAALVLVCATFGLGWLILRNSLSSVGPGLKTGAAFGAMLSAAATLVTAGALAAGVIDGPGHWVRGVRTDAYGLPLFGWATRGGDLRVPHFFATHIIQALPIVGIVADRAAKLKARTLVLIAAVGALAATALTLAQAIAGRPFLILP